MVSAVHIVDRIAGINQYLDRYQDYLDSQAPESHSSKAYVLQGGIKGWKALYTGENDLVDYD